MRPLPTVCGIIGCFRAFVSYDHPLSGADKKLVAPGSTVSTLITFVMREGWIFVTYYIHLLDNPHAIQNNFMMYYWWRNMSLLFIRTLKVHAERNFWQRISIGLKISLQCCHWRASRQYSCTESLYIILTSPCTRQSQFNLIPKWTCMSFPRVPTETAPGPYWRKTAHPCHFL